MVDVNNDGFKDVVFSYQDYNIYVALGNGDGTYQFYYNVGANQVYPTDLMVADVNGDGLPELIDAEPDHLGLYPNRGDGTFDTSTIPYYGSGTGQWSVLSVADFNGDGLADVALMNAVEGTVTFFDGVSGVKPAVYAGPLINPTRGYVSGVKAQTVLDTNGDGFDDVVLFNQGFSQDDPTLLTALGDGKGNFLYTDALPGLNAATFDFIDTVKGDFNGDGLDDIVLHTYSGVSVLLSNGDGSFRVSPVSLGAGFNCQTNLATIGDVNGDGKQDLIVAYEGDDIYSCNSGSFPSGFFTLLGNGDGTFQPATFTALGDEVYQPVLADVNGDGVLDLVVSDVVFDLLDEGQPATFNTFQLLGKGDGTFQQPTILAADYINANTLVGDLNGDGKPDLVLLTEGSTDETGSVFYPGNAGPLPLLGNGDGTYTTGTQFAPGFFSAGGLLTDLNGDGKPDLLLSEFTSYDFADGLAGGVSALGAGDGTFTARGGNFEVGDASSVVLQGDFLKDSSPDAVFVSGGSGSTLIIARGGTTVTVQANNTTISTGDSVVLNVTVAATLGGSPQPTGTVTVTENGTALGSSGLTGGAASVTLSGLAAGAHALTVVYGGDGNFNVNGTSMIVVQVLPPAAIALSASPQSLTLTVGQTGTITLTATANGSFSGTVTFSASGAPNGMSVLFNPATVTLATGQSANATLVVTTVEPKGSALKWPFTPFATGGTATLAGLMLAIGSFRLKRMRSFALSAITMGIVLTILTMTACGGGSSVTGAPKGTTTLTITATPSAPQAQPQTMPVTVVVN